MVDHRRHSSMKGALRGRISAQWPNHRQRISLPLSLVLVLAFCASGAVASPAVNGVQDTLADPFCPDSSVVVDAEIVSVKDKPLVTTSPQQTSTDAICVCDAGLVCRGKDCMADLSLRPRGEHLYSRHGFRLGASEATCVPSEGMAETISHAESEPLDLYELTCPAAVDASTASLPPIKPFSAVTWLHIPKCGSSLGTVLFAQLCQQTNSSQILPVDSALAEAEEELQPCLHCRTTCDREATCPGYRFFKAHNSLQRVPLFTCTGNLNGIALGHTPLAPKSKRKTGVVAAMFRHPLHRLMSAYNHGRHAHGMEDRNEMRARTSKWTLKQWTQYPGVQGCQTKMLLGYSCGLARNLSLSDVEAAKKRLDDEVDFAGITDAWNASLCLFHRQFGSRLRNYETVNTRPGPIHFHGLRMAQHSELETLSATDDPYDIVLFAHVVERFVQELRRFGLQVPEHVQVLSQRTQQESTAVLTWIQRYDMGLV